MTSGSSLRLQVLLLWSFAALGEVFAEEPRPYIYGSGITWGGWLGLNDTNAREFDRRSMDKIVEMGGTNCPANFAWIGIEPNQGVYDWSYVDHQVDEALARGLTIFAYTGLTPDWALPPATLAQYGPGCGYRFPPADQYIPQFEAFFRTLAARYRGKVVYYEFWNEPNGCSWINDGCSNGHMAHTYVPWLKRWYAAMKQGDPDCVLAVGGLDYNEGVTNGRQYIEDIYANGGGDSFDAVAIHPYGWPLHWEAIDDTYQVLVNHGQGHKKLWLNEYGWNTTSKATKATNLTTVLTELKKPRYDMVFQANYLVITDLPETPDSGHDYGLCSRNRNTLTITPRASWHAFAGLDKSWPISASFTAAPTAGPLPLVVQFSETSDYPAAESWSWDFGDGAGSSLRNPVHTYQDDGLYTVTLTVDGPYGPVSTHRASYITAGQLPPVSGMENPGFEAGSLAGWQVARISGEGPDNPPLSSGSFGLLAPQGSRFGGKVTSWLWMNFCLGQVVGVSEWSSRSSGARWQLNASAQLRADQNGQGQPTGIHQKWELGWNNDGSEPTDIMDCDRYVTVANLDGQWSGNGPTFKAISASGTLAVPGLRGVALRVRLWNDSSYSWSMSNFDAVNLSLTSVTLIGDFNRDMRVDAADIDAFSGCAAGPDLPIPQGCGEADLDADGDVDTADFGVLQRNLGSGT